MSQIKHSNKSWKIQPLRIEIRPSKMLPGEIGVFAVKNLPKDSVIVDASHFDDMRFVPWDKFSGLDPATQKKILAHCPGTPKGFFVPTDLNYISVAWHMNHSCNPNVGFNSHDDFVAMRTIRKNEELVWDYGFDETNPSFKMKCTCGGKQCRKIVTGNDWKILMSYAQKAKYFSQQLKNFIKKNKI